MQLTRHISTNFALGGDAMIGIVARKTPEELEELSAKLWNGVFRFEKMASRFLHTSELTTINRRAGLATHASPEMINLMQASYSMSKRTDGLYNPFLLPALQRAGYLHSAVPRWQHESVPDFRTRHLSDWSNLHIHDDIITIPQNTALDTGGIGKGYLADQLGKVLRDAGVEGYWVNLSGDIATFGHDENGQPLHIAVDGSDHIIECPSEPCGIATSGTMSRPGHTALRSAHIIDPRTGSSVKGDLRRVTVCAPSATEADVLASCAIIVGSKNAATWLKNHGATSWLFDMNHTPKKELAHA